MYVSNGFVCGGEPQERIQIVSVKPLDDMSGNLQELCWDWNGDYANENVTDPKGPASGTSRVRRGGSWFSEAANCSIAYRDYYPPYAYGDVFGFRVVRNAP